MPTADQSSTLCLSCGLCCDGTLFRRVAVGPEDNIIRLEAAGSHVVSEENVSFFVQPCVCLHDKKCGIYLDRPKVCRGFACKLLVGYHGEEISFEQADALIQKCFTLKERVEAELEQVEPSLLGVPPLALPAKLEELSAGEDGLRFRRKYGKLLLLLWALNEHITLQFRDLPSEETP